MKLKRNILKKSNTWSDVYDDLFSEIMKQIEFDDMCEADGQLNSQFKYYSIDIPLRLIRQELDSWWYS